MSTGIDWRQELDEAVATAPDRPVEQFVVSGRRALRRRRVATGLTGLAAALTIGGSFWMAAPGEGPARSDVPIATQPPSPKTPEKTTAEVPSSSASSVWLPRTQPTRRFASLPGAEKELIDFLGNPAAITEGGLVLAPETTSVLQRVENPMDYTSAQGVSLAVRAIQAGQERYSLMTADTEGGTSTSTVEATGDFAGWLDGAVRTQRTLDVANGVPASEGAQSLPDTWLTLGSDERVVAGSPGVVVLATRPDVDLGAAFSRGADRTGVVRLSVDGVLEYAAYRVVDSRLEVIAGNGRFGTLQDFVTWARSQYASGQGLR